jgi:Na+-driven multidrug efflux pump
MFLVFIFQISFIGLMIDIAQTTTLNQEQLQALSNEYKNILGWFSFFYLLSALGLDYTVNKKRAQTKGAKNEVIIS